MRGRPISRSALAEQAAQAARELTLTRWALVRFLECSPDPIDRVDLERGEHLLFYAFDLDAPHGGFIVVVHRIPQPDGFIHTSAASYYLDDLDDILRRECPTSLWFQQYAGAVRKAQSMRQNLYDIRRVLKDWMREEEAASA